MEGSSSYQGGVPLEDSGTKFQRLSDTIASNIKKISQNVSSMSKMVNQLQTTQDTEELRNQLRQIQNYTQKLVKDTSTLIMEAMKMPVDSPARRIARERLRDEYMATLNAFQATQKTAAQKTTEEWRSRKSECFDKGTIKMDFPFDGTSASQNSERPHDLVEMDDRYHQMQATEDAEREIQELEVRERDIRQLENDITDVNHIFKELGQMIHEQGAVVDSIESSVEHASTNIESGARELQQAVSYKPVAEQAAAAQGVHRADSARDNLHHHDRGVPEVSAEMSRSERIDEIHAMSRGHHSRGRGFVFSGPLQRDPPGRKQAIDWDIFRRIMLIRTDIYSDRMKFN